MAEKKRTVARSAESGEFVPGKEAEAHPDTTVVETITVPDEPAEPVAEPKPAEVFDLVGEDGRRLIRSVPYAAAADERGRVQSKTGEQLEIVPASPFVLVPAKTADK